MQAAKQAVEAGIMTPIFVGEATDINREAETIAWDISKFDLHDTTGEEAAGLKAAQLCGAGDADVLMKGQLHTDVFMKSALNRDAGLRTGNRLVHLFHISHPSGGRPIVISDAAVNVAPNIETRHDATRAVVALLQRLGTARPKIAFLSATESIIPSVPSSLEANDLAAWARDTLPEADFSGPLALDLILSP
jgi:phosphate acetyltransferase